jgi:hypothetical protein
MLIDFNFCFCFCYHFIFFGKRLNGFDDRRGRFHQEVFESFEGRAIRRHLGPALNQDLVDLVGTRVRLAQALTLLVDLAQDLRSVQTDP